MSETRDEVLEDLLSIKGMHLDMLKALFTHPNIAIVDREAELPKTTIELNPIDMAKAVQQNILNAGWLKEAKE